MLAMARRLCLALAAALLASSALGKFSEGSKRRLKTEGRLACDERESHLTESQLFRLHLHSRPETAWTCKSQQWGRASSCQDKTCDSWLALLLAAQTPSSQLYLDSLQAGGLPFRVGSGFYTPAGCNYVVDYYSQCGGSGAGCNPASGVCADAQYPGACCPVGFVCQYAPPDFVSCSVQVHLVLYSDSLAAAVGGRTLNTGSASQTCLRTLWRLLAPTH